jgi:hypothetical protein
MLPLVGGALLAWIEQITGPCTSKIGAIVAKQDGKAVINKKQNRQSSLRWGGVQRGPKNLKTKSMGASPIVVGLFGPLFVSIRGLILFYIYVNVYIT